MPDLNEQMRAELLPCPFCGSNSVKAFAYEAFIGGEPDAFCQCQGCSATGPNGKTEAEAIAAWNRRQHGSAAQAVAVAYAVISKHGDLRSMHNASLFPISPEQRASVLAGWDSLAPEAAPHRIVALGEIVAPPVADAERVSATALDALMEARQHIKHNMVAQIKVDAAIAALSRLNGEKK